MARRKARELAFQTLFQSERGGEPLMQVWRSARSDYFAHEQEDEPVYDERLDDDGVAFAERLVKAFDSHREEIDKKLEGAIEGWSFNQMAQTDLTVLRVAVTELLFEPEIPKEVTTEMAVRIAKKFGGEESGRFVNGVLAKFYHQLEQTK